MTPIPNVKLTPEPFQAMIKTALGEPGIVKAAQTSAQSSFLIIKLPEGPQSGLNKLTLKLDLSQKSLQFQKYYLKEVSVNDILTKICESSAGEQESPDQNLKKNSVSVSAEEYLKEIKGTD